MNVPPAESEDRSSISKAKRSAIGALGFAQLGDFGEQQIINSMFPAIRIALGLDVGALGTITALKRVVQVVAMPVWGALSDRYSRKGVLIWGTGAWGIWTVLIGFSQTYTHLLALTLVAAIGVAAIDGPLSSLVSDLFPKEERGRAFGVIRAIAYGAVVPTLIYLTFLTNSAPDLGWRIAFWSFGTLSMLTGLILAVAIKEPVRGEAEDALADLTENELEKEQQENPFTLAKTATLFQRRTYIWSLVDKFFMAFPTVILFAFLTTWLVDDRGVSQARAILFTLAGLLGLISGSVVGGRVGDRLLKAGDPHRHLLYGQIAQVVMAVAWLMLFSVDWGGSIPVLLLLVVVGFTQEFRVTGIVKVVVSRVLLPEVRGLGFSLERAIDSLGRVVAALLIGRLASQFGLTTAFFWTGTLVSFALIGTYCLYYTSYKRDVEAIQTILSDRARRAPANA
jgi:predicted MFS family arabinose efflux permease